MKKVILAVEQRLAEEILANIQRIEPYNSKEWNFETCPDAGQLLRERVPDVLVLSRNLPGMDSFKLLEKVKKRFNKAHVVLFIGNINERSRAYMKKAEGLGFRNFVKGGLPGERPYIFTVALQKDYDQVVGQEKGQEQSLPENDGNVITKRLAKSVMVLAYGGMWQSDKIKIVPCKNQGEVKKHVKVASMVLISSHAKDALRCIKTVRGSGTILPIVIVGPYNPELIAVGATGCVEEVDDALKFITEPARESPPF
ncbi:MAG: response regulator [Peptococcaceae bacterium]|nr:response regulator [Peptococcaceae bacterium]